MVNKITSSPSFSAKSVAYVEKKKIKKIDSTKEVRCTKGSITPKVLSNAPTSLFLADFLTATTYFANRDRREWW